MSPQSENLLDASTGELAVRNHAASRIFHRHHINFCCGGQKALRDSCRLAGVDPALVVQELEAAAHAPAECAARWDERPLADLVDHLLTHFHEPLRLELPRLLSMAGKVARVHGAHRPEMVECAQILAGLAGDMASHLDKEEQVLFPWMLSGQGSSAGSPITILMCEHDAHARAAGRLRALTMDFTPFPAACATVRALLLGLEQFGQDLIDHTHLENNILLPRALAGGAGDQGSRP
jgi:regulator of cell morphogenesis and NO signaling